uniref:Uncharacterized protein n=1 Tax=Chlorocebus sabaeus TaxID=60711 RepID=A0A0D9RTH9_CHLSB
MVINRCSLLPLLLPPQTENSTYTVLSAKEKLLCLSTRPHGLTETPNQELILQISEGRTPILTSFSSGAQEKEQQGERKKQHLPREVA